MKQFFYSILLAFVSISLISCNDDGDGQVNEFQQEKFLQAYSQTIADSFNNLANADKQYQESLELFKSNPTTSNLNNLQTAWGNLYSTYMKATAYNLGEASASGLRKALVTEIASFPANASAIDEKVNSGVFNLTDEQRTTRGLVAIEYLIFSDVQTFNQNKIDYLVSISSEMHQRIETVNNAWQGRYKTTFATNTGVNVLSSTAQFYNSWLQSLSSLQSMKVGAPIGKYDTNNNINSMLVENYYSKTSLQHLKQHFAILYAIWQGGNGTGWDDYLASLPSGLETKTVINEKFKAIETAFNALDDKTPLSELVVNDTDQINELFLQIQELEVIVKNDMSSILGIAVTATDQDGD